MPTLPTLHIETSGDANASEPSATLLDFFWPQSTPDLAVHGHPDGSRTLVRTRCVPSANGVVRWVEHFAFEAEAPTRTDLTRFEIDGTRFAETGRWRGEDDTNLHRRPVELPATITLTDRILPIPGARVTLGWCGPGLLRLGDVVEEHRLLRLCIEQGGLRMDQWFAAGIGEIATGPAWGPFGRWLVGWEGGGRKALLGTTGFRFVLLGELGGA